MPKLSYYQKKSDPSPLERVVEEHARKKILEAVRAIEMHMQLSCIAMGIIQSLSITISERIKSEKIRYLRTLNTIDVAIKRIVKSYNERETERAILKDREPELIKSFSFHNARHTFATNFCQNMQKIKAVQEIMGHSRIDVTMDVYVEATEQRKKEAIAELEKKIFS